MGPGQTAAELRNSVNHYLQVEPAVPALPFQPQAKAAPPPAGAGGQRRQRAPNAYGGPARPAAKARVANNAARPMNMANVPPKPPGLQASDERWARMNQTDQVCRHTEGNCPDAPHCRMIHMQNPAAPAPRRAPGA